MNSSISVPVLAELEGPGRDHESRQLQPLTQFDPDVTVKPSTFPSVSPTATTKTHYDHFSVFQIRTESTFTSCERDRFKGEFSPFGKNLDELKRSKVNINLTFFCSYAFVPR